MSDKGLFGATDGFHTLYRANPPPSLIDRWKVEGMCSCVNQEFISLRLCGFEWEREKRREVHRRVHAHMTHLLCVEACLAIAKLTRMLREAREGYENSQSKRQDALHSITKSR